MGVEWRELGVALWHALDVPHSTENVFRRHVEALDKPLSTAACVSVPPASSRGSYTGSVPFHERAARLLQDE